MPNPHLEPDGEQGLAAAPAGSQDASLQVGRLKLRTRAESAKQQLGADAEACAGAHTFLVVYTRLECEHG
jgi:hypothetical protein